MINGGNGIIGSKFVDNFIEKEVEFFSTFFQNSSTDDQGIFLDIRNEENVKKLGLSGDIKIPVTEGMKKYLKIHRSKLEEKNNNE